MMTHSRLFCLVLAAGSGTRMVSSVPKVLHKVAGRTMLETVLAVARSLSAFQCVVVSNPAYSHDLTPCLGDGVALAIQAEPKGTGHAVQAGMAALNGQNLEGADILVLYGDAPLVQADTLRKMLARRHEADSPAVVVSGFYPPSATGYGRLECASDTGELLSIVEEKDASPEQKKISRCNGGVMVFDAALLPALLSELSPNNAKGEYYLTDCISLARAHGRRCAVVDAPFEEMLGVNTRQELAQCEAVMQKRLRERAMSNGVTLQDPASTFLSYDTQLAQDVVVGPCVVFGEGVSVGRGAEIRSFSHLEGTTVGAQAVIGPYARLRGSSVVGAGAVVGNFVEIKNATLGDEVKACHLSYLGDVSVGDHANIGAGTITCNYDGFAKFKTSIGAGAFIGSNTSLIAPVSVGAGALVAASSVIVQDVPPNALAISRAPQKHAPEHGMTSRRKERQ